MAISSRLLSRPGGQGQVQQNLKMFVLVAREMRIIIWSGNRIYVAVIELNVVQRRNALDHEPVS